jgi:leader peptidase (prepilin peptidase)/N-methyltransferase
VVPEWFWVLSAGALGAAFGSFLNVCVYRLPRDESLLHPPSTCPRCGNRIAWYDNVPILGWLRLRGRCRSCGAPIAVEYPLVETIVAVLWAGAVWYYGMGWHAAEAAVLGTLLLGIALTDARHYVIPDEFTWGGLGLAVLLAAPQGWPALRTALIGGAAGFALLYAIAWVAQWLLQKEAMGGGDIKMMAMVGAFVGWPGVFLTVFLGALLGTVIFIPLAWLTRHHPRWERDREPSGEPGMPLVPFGIFLAAGAAVTFVVGQPLIGWYVRLAFGG